MTIKGPRALGCADLSPVERGVILALSTVTIVIKAKGKPARTVKVGARKIAVATKRSRRAVQKFVAKQTHVRPRGRPKLGYAVADVDAAVAALTKLRKRWQRIRLSTPGG